MRHQSFATTLTLSHFLTALLAVSLLGGTLLPLVAQLQQRQVVASLEAQASLYSILATTLATDTDMLAAQASTIAKSFSSLTTTIRIFTPDGSLLLTDSELGVFPSRTVYEKLSEKGVLERISQLDDRRYVAQAISVNKRVIGIIEVSQSTDVERRSIRVLVLALLSTSAVALLSAAIVGKILSRQLVRPLRQLGQVALAIGQGDFAARSSNQSHSEIGQLANQINTMANDLDVYNQQVVELQVARQEFYRNVSHELRTPLTAIRGLTENLEDDATPEQLSTLKLVQMEVTRLERLVTELIQSRNLILDPIRRRQPFDFDALADQCVTLLQPRAARAAINISATLPGKAMVVGDRDKLRQALLRLLDDMVKASPVGGQVMLASEHTASKVRLTIRGTRPKGTVETHDRMSEHDVHGDEYGQNVGFVLTREIIEAHGGGVELLDGWGTTMVVTLPLQQ